MQLDAEPLVVALAAQIGTLPAETVLVGIHTGGVWVAERLHASLGMSLPIGKLAVTLHRDDFSRIGLHPQKKATEMPFDVNGRDIVLVDDVLNSGRTLRAALNELFDFGRPASVKLAVLVDRGRRELPFAADYIGATMSLDAGQELVLANEQDHLRFTLQEKHSQAASR
ncbi:MAG: bifunctional pyr operon transcriptional regulator/uracil phosphoribosyltransferase PyrR [Betaproteobacteria bacterium]